MLHVPFVKVTVVCPPQLGCAVVAFFFYQAFLPSDPPLLLQAYGLLGSSTLLRLHISISSEGGPFHRCPDVTFISQQPFLISVRMSL